MDWVLFLEYNIPLWVTITISMAVMIWARIKSNKLIKNKKSGKQQ